MLAAGPWSARTAYYPHWQIETDGPFAWKGLPGPDFTVSVAGALGFDLGRDLPEKTILHTDKEGEIITSMLMDMRMTIASSPGIMVFTARRVGLKRTRVRTSRPGGGADPGPAGEMPELCLYSCLFRCSTMPAA